MDFFVLIEKTCSLCIVTFGANIVIVVNFIVAVTVIAKLICQLHVNLTTVKNVLSGVICEEQAARSFLEQGNASLVRGNGICLSF